MTEPLFTEAERAELERLRLEAIEIARVAQLADITGKHPLQACLDEAEGYLQDAERELGFGDEAGYQLVQACKWLHAGLESVRDRLTHNTEPVPPEAP